MSAEEKTRQQGDHERGSTVPAMSSRWLLLDVLVVFLGAFLLFLIQPAYSKFILPWFGGAPLVWATALVFFQTALLAGYGYAHLLVDRVPPRAQLMVHATLLLLSLWMLPVAPGEQWKPEGMEAPTLQIVMMLIATLGLPYMLLASTSPLVQAWIARHRHQMAPYRLFSLSNFASVLGLLSYPFLIEPALGLQLQFQAWAWGYGLYVLCACGLTLITARAIHRPDGAAGKQPARADAAKPGDRHPVSTRTQLIWIALAACPSLLFLATTQHLTLDVAPVPFLWVLPLVIYLFTFVICFEFPHALPRRLLGLLAVLSVTAVSILAALPFLVGDYRVQILLFCGGLFLMALFCHAELYARRPNARHLTRFYLMTALGGALGGSFVGLLAHHLFNGYHEIYVGLAGCGLLVFLAEYDRSNAVRAASENANEPAASGAAAQPNRAAPAGRHVPNTEDFQVTFALAVPLCAAALAAAMPFAAAGKQSLRADRNFFGALRVVEVREHGVPVYRQLDHGSTKHGLQFLAPEKRCLATTYFSTDSGAGRLLESLGKQQQPLRVGIIGLGIGTLAAYAEPGDRYVFYEINPLMERIAREDFGFLSECAEPVAEGVEVRLGDARIQLEQEADNQYDVFLIDAFSGDSIPTHLLTREAFELYATHLSGDGVMAINISNRYLDLRPVIRAAATAAGFETRFVGTERDAEAGGFDAVWGILSRDAAIFNQPLLREGIARTQQSEGEVLWTDDFSNLFRVLQ
jgi:hypothetical protein